jgi:hypothetical protein
MNPPPTTTARCGFSTVWNPVYLSIPVLPVWSRSSHCRIARASGTVRTEKMPGRSMPGSGGRIGAAPGDSTSLS